MKKAALIIYSIVLIPLFLVYRPSFAQACNTGDGNGDGKVDGVDYVTWLNNYGK